MIQAPRELLAAAGLTVGEPENTRKQTRCCGGPAEALYPAKAVEDTARRAGQLRAVAPDCVTMCPICLINLRKTAGATIRVRDISDYLAQAAG